MEKCLAHAGIQNRNGPARRSVSVPTTVTRLLTDGLSVGLILIVVNLVASPWLQSAAVYRIPVIFPFIFL
jgi:hypothetical protein